MRDSTEEMVYSPAGMDVSRTVKLKGMLAFNWLLGDESSCLHESNYGELGNWTDPFQEIVFFV